MVRNIEELRGLFGEKPPRELKPLADGAGVPLGTVVRILRGFTKNPRIDTFQKLADAANRLQA